MVKSRSEWRQLLCVGCLDAGAITAGRLTPGGQLLSIAETKSALGLPQRKQRWYVSNEASLFPKVFRRSSVSRVAKNLLKLSTWAIASASEIPTCIHPHFGHLNSPMNFIKDSPFFHVPLIAIALAAAPSTKKHDVI